MKDDRNKSKIKLFGPITKQKSQFIYIFRDIFVIFGGFLNYLMSFLECLKSFFIFEGDFNSHARNLKLFWKKTQT
jgi:hypothetical protein